MRAGQLDELRAAGLKVKDPPTKTSLVDDDEVWDRVLDSVETDESESDIMAAMSEAMTDLQAPGTPPLGLDDIARESDWFKELQREAQSISTITSSPRGQEKELEIVSRSPGTVPNYGIGRLIVPSSTTLSFVLPLDPDIGSVTPYYY